MPDAAPHLEYFRDENWHLVLASALDGDAQPLPGLLRHLHSPLPLGDLVGARPLVGRQRSVGLHFEMTNDND